MNLIFLITAAGEPLEEAHTVFQEAFNSKRLKKGPQLPEIKHRLSLLGELAVREALSEIRGTEKSNLERLANEYGKPYFKGFEDFYFNTSHSGNAVAVAVADFPIGLDIEKIGAPNLAVAGKLADNEKRYIFEKDDEKVRRFYEIWTKKEAFLKQKGIGLSVPLSSFDVTEKGIAERIKTFCCDGLFISACTEQGSTDFKLIKLTEEEFLKLIAQKRLVSQSI